MEPAIQPQLDLSHYASCLIHINERALRITLNTFVRVEQKSRISFGGEMRKLSLLVAAIALSYAPNEM